jgi:hypothetical protein
LLFNSRADADGSAPRHDRLPNSLATMSLITSLS